MTLKRWFFLLAGGLCFASWSQSISITDARGKELRLEQPAQTIVSLLPSLTESVCELGACDRLVGVDRYSNWPTSIRKLPRLGGGLDANFEAILRLKPDLVLAATSSRIGERLEQLGLKVLMLEPQSHDDVRRSLQILDSALGTRRSDTVWQNIQQQLAHARDRIPVKFRQSRVYFEIDPTPYAAGKNSFIGETLAMLDLKNIIDASLGHTPKINPEFVVLRNPEIIVIAEQNASNLSKRPGWRTIAALEKKQICALTLAQSDWIVRSGPRIGQGALQIAQCLEDWHRK